MSRSASDATRFTATSPQAKPSAYRSTAQSTQGRSSRGGASQPPRGNNGQGPQGTETPQEKVARLRAQHAAKRAAEVSSWDRVVMRGRSLADSAHRITVLGLVGMSAVAGAVTIYSLIDLSRYNRKKKREWLEVQWENLQKELVEASKAERAGTATPEQMLLLNRERAADQAKREKEQRKGITGTIKGLFSTEGLKKEEVSEEDRLLASGAGDAVAKDIPVAPVPDPVVPRMGTEAEGPVTAALTQFRRQGEDTLRATGAQGGPLDQFASATVNETKKQVQGWSSWLGFGSGSK